MVYVYAIAEELGDISHLAGVRGEPLLLVAFGRAVVVAGEMTVRPPLEPAILRAQDALVRALHDRARALLPMRFGTTSADREEVLRAIDAHGDLATRLAAVRDCEQMVVRVLGTLDQETQPVSAAATGTQYLEARAKRHQPGPALAALAAGVGDLPKSVKIEPSSQPGLLGAVYHLIERGRADEYRRAIDHRAAQLPDVRILVSGPSPPYAFA
jgi:hypothetical protein